MISFISRKISWILRRHPLLYYLRYVLISSNFQGKLTDDIGCFNLDNDKNEIPQLYFDVNQRIEINEGADEFVNAQKIAIFLKNNISSGPGLGLSSEKMLEAVLEGKGGVCSDFSLLFNVFCLVNDIKVREWGCVDNLYNQNYGHSFNEIYSSDYKKWIALDSSNGIYFTDCLSNIPMSTTELFEFLRNGNPLNYSTIGDPPDNDKRLLKIYSKETIPFLIGNYKNTDNDYYLNKFHGIPAFIVNAVIILRRKNHKFIFVLDNYKQKLLPKYFRDFTSE